MHPVLDVLLVYRWFAVLHGDTPVCQRMALKQRGGKDGFKFTEANLQEVEITAPNKCGVIILKLCWIFPQTRPSCS